jgi:hypothetical protein
MGFMEFVASQPTEQFSRDLSFILIPRKKRGRLTRVLCIIDRWYRATVGQVDQYLHDLYPKVDLESEATQFTNSREVEILGNVWQQPISPYNVLQRLFTFYCDSATVVTSIPIWVVTMECRNLVGAEEEGEPPQERVFSCTSGFLSTLTVPVTTVGKGKLRCKLYGFAGDVAYEPLLSQPPLEVWSVNLTAFPIPRPTDGQQTGLVPQPAAELRSHTIVDPSLLLTVKCPSIAVDDLIVDEVDCTWQDGKCKLELDGVPFTGVVHFSVERFRHPITQEPVDFPLRTFADISP